MTNEVSCGTRLRRRNLQALFSGVFAATGFEISRYFSPRHDSFTWWQYGAIAFLVWSFFGFWMAGRKYPKIDKGEHDLSFGEKIAYPGLLFAETGTWIDLDGVAQTKPMPFPFNLKVGLSTAYAVRAKLIVNGPGFHIGLTPEGRQAYDRMTRWKVAH